jgi:hypothetical protein
MAGKMFKGVSKKGDFQEALTRAVDKALQSTGGEDIIVKWKLYEVNGEKGGLAPRNTITVTIQVLP